MLKSVHETLFGAVRKIDIHCSSPNMGGNMQDGLRQRLNIFDQSIPISVKLSADSVNFVMIHYSKGLFRPQHADVLVMS